MHFEQPELLYALILLVIPLIVHLFRLRKFQKEDFTNVKFLKKVIQETRKSSRLKKFLILITRLLLLTCLILAFAKPFIPASEKALAASQTLIYLDNSFSMQSGDEQSTIFNKAVNSLLEYLDDENKYSLFTNSDEYFDRGLPDLKDELQNFDFVEDQISYREIKLKAENYFKKYPLAEKDLVIISDFQTHINIPSEATSENINYHLIQPNLHEINNASLDSAYINEITPESLTLNIVASSNRNLEEPISISVYDGKTLLGRNTIQLGDEKSEEITFRLQNTLIAKGRIEIEDSGLKYDNTLFFNINENPGIKVVIISALEVDFLTRIYNEPEFETRIFTPNQIDYNQLNSANLIVLNEVDQLPPSLINNLGTANDNGATVILIPPVDAQEYGQILNSFGFSDFTQKVDAERLITSISFDHPLLENVFEDRIDNFEYPKVLSSQNHSSSNAILSYQDNRPFLAESNSVYLFTAALNNENSNFRNSPLIVPVFYQIGLKAFKKNQLYYSTNKESEIDVPVDLGKDQVVHLVNYETDIIPQQQNYSSRIEISTGNIDLEAGNYEVSNNNQVVGNLSFNYSRKESQLTYTDISDLEDVNIYNSVEEYFSKSNAATQITTLWKWFVIFALIFLAIEMLLIKFLK
ncbi:vWA domain-containing protein [Christiangramia echinicola]|uniref:vWA domain-containing protein n=1 Tax=Christiangramia echinicola TaxID=279359 RepID=UPI00041C8E89|nr:BatA and WFA domain-containing protein [Christiangramia echinicola]